MPAIRERYIGLLAVVAASGLLCCSYSQAKPPGGGGGGGTDKNATAYTIIPFLPPGPASTASFVNGLNEQGQAVGTVEYPDGELKAVHFDIASDVYTELQDGENAYGVNKLNQTVGTIGGDLSLAAFWSTPSASPVVLPPLSGDVESVATAINDSGVIVGSSVGSAGWSAVAWRAVIGADGVAQVNGPLLLSALGDNGATANDVNEVVDGTVQVVGTDEGGNSGMEAVLWTISVNENGTLGGSSAPVSLGTLQLFNPTRSEATGVNNFGAVSGGSDLYPFVANPGMTVEALKVPRQFVSGFASDINDAGDCVGFIELWSNAYQIGIDHAYLWRNGDPVDLEKLIDSRSGWQWLAHANRINNGGLIAGEGNFDVQRRGFVMTPNP